MNDGIPIRVLLVDDEEDFLLSMGPALGRRGIDVEVAKDGREALCALAARTPDVVVLDVRMPGMSGEEVHQYLVRERPELPVIMLTGHGSVPQAFRMSKAGVVEYLEKPCDPPVLAERIRRAVGLAGAGSRARPR